MNPTIEEIAKRHRLTVVGTRTVLLPNASLLKDEDGKLCLVMGESVFRGFGIRDVTSGDVSDFLLVEVPCETWEARDIEKLIDQSNVELL